MAQPVDYYLHQGDVKCVNIRSFIKANTTGELRDKLSGFVCSKNKDVQRFLRRNAIRFTEEDKSVTYLVFETETADLLGYFTLVSRGFRFPNDVVERFIADLSFEEADRFKSMIQPNAGDRDSDQIIQGFLIAQLGKNSANTSQIEGKLLLSLALEEIEKARYLVGGRIVFVEAEPIPKLLKFYVDNGFQEFSSRVTAKDQELQQLIRIL